MRDRREREREGERESGGERREEGEKEKEGVMEVVVMKGQMAKNGCKRHIRNRQVKRERQRERERES